MSDKMHSRSLKRLAELSPIFREMVEKKEQRQASEQEYRKKYKHVTR